MATVRDLIEVDDDVEELRRMDRARILIRTSRRPLLHHSVAARIGEETHTVFIVEEGLSDVGTRAHRRFGVVESTKEIESQDTNNDVPSAAVEPVDDFRHPLQGFDGDRDTHLTDHWSKMLHHGPSPMDDPANNSKSSWRYLPSSEVSARTEERTAEPQDPMNHSEVDPVEHDGGDRVRESPNRNGKGIRPKPTLSRGGTDCMYKESLVDHRTDDPDSPFEAAMIQIGPSKSHIFKNGPSTEVGFSKHTITSSPHTPMNSPIKLVTPSTPLAPPKISNVTQPIEAGQHIELGSTIHTAPFKPIHPFDSPKHQTAAKEREWKVYVRSKGCKQKQAQETKKHNFLEDPNPPPHHQSTSGASTPPSEMRCQLSATHSSNQSMRNNPGPSSTVEGPNEELIKEASSQWELAKLMGVHTDADQATIINKFTAMEVRDRQQAQELGDRNLLS